MNTLREQGQQLSLMFKRPLEAEAPILHNSKRIRMIEGDRNEEENKSLEIKLEDSMDRASKVV